MTPESQIQADVEALRQQVTETQDLYREVSALLFFRYGITPTANKLYQYVRKGSMSAPAEALARFWNDLREKSRVRIEHPDLPEELRSAAGDLVAALWTHAQSSAQDGLKAFRADAQTAVEHARMVREAAEQEVQATTRALDQTLDALGKTSERVLVLERELAAERAAKESLAGQLASSQQQREALEDALTEARRDFAAELEKLREALHRSEARLEAGEKRALLEIDRERTAASKAQKDLAQLRETQALTTQAHREELAHLQAQLGEARQKVGTMEGSILELRKVIEHQALELQALRSDGTEKETLNAVLRKELSGATTRIAALEEELKKSASAKVAAPKRRRKTLDVEP